MRLFISPIKVPTLTLFQAPAKESFYCIIMTQLIYETSRLCLSSCQVNLQNFMKSLIKQEETSWRSFPGGWVAQESMDPLKAMHGFQECYKIPVVFIFGMHIWGGQSLVADLKQVKNHVSTPTFSFKIFPLVCYYLYHYIEYVDMPGLV